jgi:hypothetical protein
MTTTGGAPESMQALILLLGAFLIWIPVVALLVTGAIVARLLRGHFQRTP